MAEKVVKLRSEPPGENPFRVGDEVVLKSGGSYMTVRGYEKDGCVIVDWHIDDGTPACADYLPAMLMTRPQYEAANA